MAGGMEQRQDIINNDSLEEKTDPKIMKSSYERQHKLGKNSGFCLALILNKYSIYLKIHHRRQMKISTISNSQNEIFKEKNMKTPK